MEEKVKKIIGNSLEELNLVVDSVVYEKENGVNFLRICLDSKDTIDLDLIVKATHIINPLMDKANIIDEEYHLDIYGKSKGN
jgi:ribosome maturation factor RimP